jgi:F-type H+-transporting ATPase subunit b
MPQFEQVSVFSSLIFWSVISFGLLFFLLKKFAFPPILDALEMRQEKIKADLDATEKLKAEAQSLREKLDLEFKGAHDKAETIVQMASSEAKKIQERTLKETESKVRQMQNDVEREIQTSRNKLLGEIRSYTAALTIASTEKFLKKVLDDTERKRIADESIEEVIREMEQRQSN